MNRISALATIVAGLLSLSIMPSEASAAPPAIFSPPSQGGSLVLYLDGLEAGRFLNVTAGGAEIEAIPQPIEKDQILRKRPGRTKYSDVTVKKGAVSNRLIDEWFQKVVAGTVDRKSVSVVYLDSDGDEVMRLNLFEAWPVSYEVGQIPGPGGAPTVESFALSFGGFERIAPAPRRLPRGNIGPAFDVLIDGVPVVGVVGVSASRTAVVNPGDGTAPFVDGGTFTLKLDGNADPRLHTWFGETAKGRSIRKNITINLRTDRGANGRTYTYHECWPDRWTAPAFSSGSDTYIVEELEFVVEKVERI